MSSQDIESLFKKNPAVEDLTNKIFSKEKAAIDLFTKQSEEKKILSTEQKVEKHRSIISKNQREYIKRKLKGGKRSVTMYLDDELMTRLDTEVGYETNRSDKVEQIIEFYLKYKDEV